MIPPPKKKGTRVLTSILDIRRKFFELERLQDERLAQSFANPDDTQWRIDDSDEVRSRNRYSNVSPWDCNRVHLNVPEDHCDYINASPIVLRSRKDGSAKRYIATQVHTHKLPPATPPLGVLWRVRRARRLGPASTTHNTNKPCMRSAKTSLGICTDC